jgi:hypothetical protein
MLVSVLKSEAAIKMNLAIARAFIALRQIAHQYKELSEKLATIEQSSNVKYC